MILQKLKADAEAYLGETVTDAVDHRAGVLQRRAAPGDQGRRQDRRARTCCASSTSRRRRRSPTGSTRRTTRRSSSSTSAAARSTSRCSSSATASSRSSRPTATPTSAATTSTRRVVDWMVAEFKREQGIDLSKDPHGAAAPLRSRREGQDRALVHAVSADINLPFITADADGPEAPRPVRSRAPSSNELTARPRRAHRRPDASRRSRTPASTPSEIDEVVLVGGMTRMPAVQDMVKELLGKEPHRGVNPDEVVAIGAAIQAGVLTRRGQGRAAARRHAAVARHRDHGRRDDQAHRAQHHHPDAQVARSSRRPRTTRRRSRSTCSRASARWPASTRRSASSSSSASRRRRAACRRSRSRSTSTPTASCSVSAKDLGTGNEQKIEVRSGSGLSDDEIDRMVEDAEAHAEEDRGCATWPTPRTRRDADLLDREVPARARRQDRRRHAQAAIETAHRATCARRSRATTPRRSAARTQALDRGLLQAGRGRLRRTRGAAARRATPGGPAPPSEAGVRRRGHRGRRDREDEGDHARS